MIRLLTPKTRIGLVVAAMAVAVPMVTVAQTTEPGVGPVQDASGTEDDTTVETDPSARTTLPAEVEVEIQRRDNALRSERLDDREAALNRWFWGIGVFITLVVAGGGYIIKEIKRNRNKFDEMVRSLNAKAAAEDPEEVTQAVKVVLKNPQASLIDKTIANAVSLQRQGKKDDAIERWRTVARVAEGSDNDIAARAWSSVGYLIQDKSPKDGILAYDKVIRLQSDYADAYNNRGIVKEALGRHEDAIADYDEAIRLQPDYVIAYNNRGNVKKALGRHEDAIADYDDAIRLQPDYVIAYYNRGNAKGALGRHEDAIADQDKVIRLKPDYAIAYNNRGNMKEALGRHEDAIADYDEAIRLQPDYVISYSNRGVAKGALKRYDDAIADYDEAIRLQSDYADAYNNRGVAKCALGQQAEAIVDYDEAIRLKPDFAGTYYNRGAVKHTLGQLKAAIADYNKAIRLQPDYADAYYKRGKAKCVLGLKNEARRDFEAALKLVRNVGAANIVAQVEQSLRDLDDAEGHG